MTSIGTNLAAVNYWTTEEPFIDRFKTAGSWGAYDANGKDISSNLVLDANGYVAGTNHAAKIAAMVNVDPHDSSPNNQYVLTYSGTASLSISNANIVSSTAGKVVFEVKSETGGFSDVMVTFKGLNDASPITNVHVVRTDQVSLFNAGEIFNPTFVDKVAQWDVVRFMDWGGTNKNNDVSWNTRTTLTDASWGGGQTTDGVPLEAMVKLANEAHVDMWYNVPTKADDAYVTNALTYIRDNLSPDLKVHVEYSNEVWNSGFAQFGYAQDRANALWGKDANANGTIDASEAVAHGTNIYYGYRAAQVVTIAEKVFGAEASDRVVGVLAGQGGNSGLMTYMLQGVAKAGLGAANSIFQDYAIAPYFGGQFSGPAAGTADHDTILGWARGGAAGLAAAFKELESGGQLSKDGSLVAMNASFIKSQGVASNAGLNLVAYEGGINFFTSRWPAAEQAEVQAFFEKMLEDPRMSDIYTKLLDNFTAHGGTSFVAFTDAAKDSTSGHWGVLDDIYDDGSPRYAALTAAQGGRALHDQALAPGAGQKFIAHQSGGAISGGDGNDTILAGAGNDMIDGGAGDDRVVGSSGSMRGNQYIESDFYQGGAGSDTIIGGMGNDHIYGNHMTTVAGAVDGADSLSGGAGMDYINGNAGNDTIDGGSGDDRLYGGQGNDLITGGADNDYLQGNRGADTMSGGDGADVVHGGADNDMLAGDAGADSLYGDAGDDRLVGGIGFDVLSGGSGADTFVFAAGDASFYKTGKLAYSGDEITDFAHGQDRIDLGFQVAAVIQGAARTASAAFDFATQQLGAHVGEHDVVAVTVGSDTFLYYDGNGAGGAIDSAIKVDGLGATSFGIADFAF